uniref:hypothetical protein n=1 Tax=Prochlorococcus sp. SS52 TaxID=1499501 RepID=UPI000563E8B9|nr:MULTISPECIES: hypothetical protein [Prochlorococcus]
MTTAATKKPNLVVVMVSNGPGELTTWVKPLAEKLHSSFSLHPSKPYSLVSLRLVLVPCPNATGKEKEVAEKWGIFETVSKANNFWSLLINPQKYGFWPSKGVVVFLGGDQFWSVLLAARLKYKNITYAEWVARWPFWNDRIAAMSPKVKENLPKKLQKRCVVVGDLMADLQKQRTHETLLPKGKWIAIFPGSKKAKLCVGIPFFLQVVDELSALSPECNFLMPIAPTTNLQEIINFNSSKNPITKEYKSKIQSIELPNEQFSWKRLKTKAGNEIHLIEDYPAHGFVSQCNLALTTIGANTAELGALTIPMIVVVPTQHIHVMQAWDGFLGIIARLPIFKWCFGILLSIWRMRSNRYMAWPNITAKKMIVPERIGKILPSEIAKESNDWISSPERLQGQKEDLRSLRGNPGAIDSMAKEIINLLYKSNI